jgi:hypothetical protein
LINTLFYPLLAEANESSWELGDYQYIYNDMGKKIFTVQIKNPGDIYFFGKHVISNSGYTYHTVGFNVSLEGTNKNIYSI